MSDRNKSLNLVVGGSVWLLFDELDCVRGRWLGSLREDYRVDSLNYTYIERKIIDKNQACYIVEGAHRYDNKKIGRYRKLKNEPVFFTTIEEVQTHFIENKGRI